MRLGKIAYTYYRVTMDEIMWSSAMNPKDDDKAKIHWTTLSTQLQNPLYLRLKYKMMLCMKLAIDFCTN